MFSSCKGNFISPGITESADDFWIAWFREKIVEAGIRVQNVVGKKVFSKVLPAVLQWVDVIQDHRRPAVDLRVDYSHCSSLKRLQRLSLAIYQARVPDWAGILKDWPHDCLVKAQQVLS